MFQGVEVEHLNYEEFAFNPREINCVFLTHSHLDHCGLLPKLYKEGFRGKVYMTPPTRAIIEFMLLDSAKVQELRFRESREGKKYKGWTLLDGDLAESSIKWPIYDTTDVLGLLELCTTEKFGEEFENNGIQAKFLRAGHALGAASVLLVVEGKRFIFSGDLGNPRSRLDSVLNFPRKAEYIVMESLYGGRFHEDRTLTEEKFLKVINKTLSRGGNIIIPSFTYQRSQEILFLLKSLTEKGNISRDVRVFLDSPLAINITGVYKKYFKYLNPKVVRKYKSGESIFYSPNFVFAEDSKASKRIRKRRGSIIVAGHGMCAGGRIVYHLRDNLDDRRSSIVFVGFQAPGTLGREIIDGKKEVLIEDKKVRVKAEIVKLYGFSAHADHEGLLNWLSHTDKKDVKQVFLVHGEEETSRNLKESLEKDGYSAIIPEWKEEYEV